MTHELLKKKVIAEIEVSPKGLTTYGVLSFMANEITTIQEATKFMISEGYKKSEVAKAKASYHHNQTRKALSQARAF
jgi:hypothetical protein